MNKKNAVIGLALVALLGGSVYGAYELGQRSAAPSAAPAAPAAAARQPLYWHDPMVPGQKFDKPGKSPYMDMALVPVYAEEGADSGVVSISPRVQQNLGVRTATVSRGALPQAWTAVGNVAFNEREVTLVQARANGFVERVLVRTLLEPVRKGQPLAQLYVPEWVAAQEEFLAVRRMPAAEPALLDGARQRMRLAGMEEQHIRQVEASGKVQARSVLTAPASGVVTELAAREGMSVAMGAPLYRINGTDTVWVNAELPENMQSQLAVGSPATASIAALPGLVLQGRVAAILPEVNPATRTLRARIELPNPQRQLVAGMFATVSLAARGRAPVLLVPAEAVIRTGTRNVVMLEQGPGKFAAVEVALGQEAGGQVEVRSGLQEGQKVAASGQFLLDSEASLKGSVQRMGEGAATVTHQGDGVLEAIGQDEVTVSHGPIATLKWPAMTMAFKLAPGRLPAGLAPGARITFRFVQGKEGEFEITEVQPAAAAPAHVHGDHK